MRTGTRLAGVLTRTAVRWWRGLAWYLREATGEAEYDRHVQRHRLAHPGEPVPGRRAFERERAEHRERHPKPRCC